MLVGIVSDTHDDMEALRRAVDFFNRRGAGSVVHAGDFCSPFTREILGDLDGSFAGIFGNNDGDRLLLRQRYQGAIHQQPWMTTLGGRKAVLVHEPVLVDTLVASGKFDLVVFGHTHRAVIERRGGTLVVNPGKAARLHRGEATVSLLDTGRMEVEVVHLFADKAESSR